MPQRKQGKCHAGCYNYTHCKAAGVTLQEIDVKTQGEAQQTIPGLWKYGDIRMAS